MNVDALVDRIVDHDRVARSATASTSARSSWPRGSRRCCPTKYIQDIATRRARPHLDRQDRSRQADSPSWSQREYETRTGKKEGDRPPARLRVALRAAARVRRDARQPARHRRLPRARRAQPRWRHGVGLRPIAIALRAIRSVVDPQTLVTKVRYIEPESDLHKLARFLETEVNE